MKPALLLIPTLAAAFTLSGCDDYDIAVKSKEIVISKAEYEQLKAAALEAKQVGRYQIHREGFRTWRLDTSTGRSCILLSTAEDWKKPETTNQSCASEDWSEAQKRHRLYPSLYDQNGDPLPQKE